jgi:hypothetical protein
MAMDDGVSEMILAAAFIVFIAASAVTAACDSGKKSMHRHLAAKQCAPRVAMFSDDTAYRYVCVEKQ